MYCERCGVKNNDTAKNCIGCGADLEGMLKKDIIEGDNFDNTQTFGNFSFAVEKELSENKNSFNNTVEFNEGFQRSVDSQNALKEKSKPLEIETDVYSSNNVNYVANNEYEKKKKEYSNNYNKEIYNNDSSSNKERDSIPTYMVLSIVTLVTSFLFTCVCCGIFPLVTSIIALVSSMGVKSNLARGNVEVARRNSSRAKIWGIISIITLILSLVFILISAAITYLYPEFINKIIEPSGYQLEIM